MYLRRPPAPALAPFVESVWYCALPAPYHLERALPTGSMQLLVNLHADELASYRDGRGDRVAGAALQGVTARPAMIDTAHQRAIAGVSFRPGGAYPFFAAPASATADLLVGLGDLWGHAGPALRERLLAAPSPAAALDALERTLLSRVARTLEPDPGLEFAVRAFERGVAVGDVTDRLGTTRQSFARRFSERVGLTPKRYARVRRFQRLLAVPGMPGDWAARAAHAGYYDQAHMIHEFRELAGMSPTEYHPRAPDMPNHVTISTSQPGTGRAILAV
jgi:AraC-like DNA-binding protein